VERVSPTRLRILYEDAALVFVDKPSGLVVQRRVFAPDEPCLHDLVRQHTSPAFLLQRLDRGTSGVIFFSKRADVNARLTRHFKRKLIGKTYLAICDGELAEPRTIDAPIARVGTITFGVRDHGKRAVTTSGRWRRRRPAPWSRSRSRPAARTRFASICPPSVIPWPATGSTARTTPRDRCFTPPRSRWRIRSPESPCV
jgi:23S rRNA-/tRNA-specific pseudouridylate synthase